jgi:glycosyltransferase involved in cell wall biosynthesis
VTLVSVLTAAHAGRAELLVAAGDSVALQRLPAGWELEWVVQEDGAEPELAGVASTARYQANQARLGIAVTRNLALARVSGELVHVLDSDDVLLPGALGTALAAFQRYPQIHWVAAQADDLMPDGSRIPYPLAFPAGPVAPGALNVFTEEHGEPPVSCAGLTMRTATVRALGGWAANPCSEDVALLAAVAELTPGYITPEVTWLIRQHDGRTTRGARWPHLCRESVAMVRQRIAALRELGQATSVRPASSTVLGSPA